MAPLRRTMGIPLVTILQRATPPVAISEKAIYAYQMGCAISRPKPVGTEITSTGQHVRTGPGTLLNVPNFARPRGRTAMSP
jgi:hypothetical protein